MGMGKHTVLPVSKEKRELLFHPAPFSCKVKARGHLHVGSLL